MRLRIFLAASVLIATSACQHDEAHERLEEELQMTYTAPTVREEAPAPVVSEQTVVMESPIPDSPAGLAAVVVDQPVAAPVAPRNPYLEPATDPHLYFRSPFDPHDDVPPWRANYIGSYGELPTRFQDKGPFLYSFDISPDANIFTDDDFGPIDDD